MIENSPAPVWRFITTGNHEDVVTHINDYKPNGLDGIQGALDGTQTRFRVFVRPDNSTDPNDEYALWGVKWVTNLEKFIAEYLAEGRMALLSWNKQDSLWLVTRQSDFDTTETGLRELGAEFSVSKG